MEISLSMSDEERRSQKIECLPENLMEAIDALRERYPLICGVLGSHICKRYIEAKKEEWKDYCAAVSNWEHRSLSGEYSESRFVEAEACNQRFGQKTGFGISA